MTAIEIVLASPQSPRKEEIQKILTQQANAPIDTAAIQADILAIFALGRIFDVSVEHLDSGVLQYHIEEWPSRVDFVIKGKKPGHAETYDYIPYRYFSGFSPLASKEELTLQTLKSSGLEVQENLRRMGYLHATVETDISIAETIYSLEKEFIVEYKLSIGEKYYINSLKVTGNKYFSQREINDLITTKPAPASRKKIKSGQFSQALVENDIVTIKAKYFIEGFLDVDIKQTISIDNKKYRADVFIEILEGTQYKIDQITRSEGLDKPEFKKNDAYKIDKIKKYINAEIEKHQNQGYANAVVNPEINIDQEKHTVSIHFRLEKGELFYFGKTNSDIYKKKNENYDSLIEFREGDLYSKEKIDRTKKNLLNKKNFSEVSINTEVSDKPNVLTVNIRTTRSHVEGGRLLAYASLEEAAFLYHYVTLNNAFGYGNVIESQYKLTRDEQLVSLGLLRNLRYGQTIGVRGFFVDPVTRDYDTEGLQGEDDRIDAFDIVEPLQTYRKLGASLLLRQPLTKKLTASLAYSLYTQRESTRREILPAEIDGEGRRGLLEGRLVFDTRNFGERGHERDLGGFTSQGWLLAIQGNVSASWLGSTADFASIGLRGARFFTLREGGRTNSTPGGITLKVIGRFDSIWSLDAKEIAFGERYLLGGMGSLRGFRQQSLGPTIEAGANIGGTRAYGGTLELELPFVDELAESSWRRFRWAIFMDAAGVDGGINAAVESALHKDFGVLPVRTSAGVSVRWYVSYLFGPVRLDIARPLDVQPGEGIQAHFSISTEL